MNSKVGGNGFVTLLLCPSYLLKPPLDRLQEQTGYQSKLNKASKSSAIHGKVKL
jgi:hypothetical protein